MWNIYIERTVRITSAIVDSREASWAVRDNVY